MRTMPQRPLAALAILASTVALYNQGIAAAMIAAGAMAAWAVVTAIAARRAG
jgi:hypothetical protein